jgi:hypothetical protein
LLCIFGIARSGSNYLCSVLANQPGIEGRFEIFNKNRSNFLRPEELVELSRRSGETFPPVTEDPAAIRIIRQDPTRTLDCLADMLPPAKRLLIFKVLRKQLLVQQLGDEIIARPDTAVAFLRRRPIDAFISSRKATLLQKWAGVDTTDMKIDIEVGDFLKWGRATADWYRRLEKTCWLHGKPFYRLSYEQDIDVAPDVLVQRLRSLVSACGMNEAMGPTVGPPTRFVRQDRTAEVVQRVANWAAFEQDLAATGEGWKAFSPFPHYEPTWRDRRRRLLRPLWRRLRRATKGAG